VSAFDLRLGDCLDPVTGLASLPDKSVDAVVSDPPYGERTHAKQFHGRRERSAAGDGKWCTSVGLGYEHLTPERVAVIGGHFARIARGWVCVMTSHDLVDHWEAALGRYTFAPLPIVLEGMNVRLAGDGPSSWCVWLVVNRPRGLVDGTKPGAYVGSPGRGPDRAANPVKGHKPLWLMERILGDYTKPGDLVCDPFSGSGTTGVAAIRLGRRFIGWERDPKYHAVAMKRLSAAREQLRMPLADAAEARTEGDWDDEDESATDLEERLDLALERADREAAKPRRVTVLDEHGREVGP